MSARFFVSIPSDEKTRQFVTMARDLGIDIAYIDSVYDVEGLLTSDGDARFIRDPSCMFTDDEVYEIHREHLINEVITCVSEMTGNICTLTNIVRRDHEIIATIIKNDDTHFAFIGRSDPEYRVYLNDERTSLHILISNEDPYNVTDSIIVKLQ